jgi:hypothetical protein
MALHTGVEVASAVDQEGEVIIQATEVVGALAEAELL